MIVAVLLALAVPPPVAAPPPSSPEDIVVVAERLKRLRIVTRTDRRTGVTRCVYKRRSGDPALDRGVCDALLICVARESTRDDVVTCLKPSMAALVPKTPWRATEVRDDRRGRP